MPRVIALLVILNIIGVKGDGACLQLDGRCQTNSISCLGGYRSRLCSGASNRRCCLPASGDTQCSALNGFCQADTTSCPGGYRSGICAGGSNRRCCLPEEGGLCLTSSEMTDLQDKLIEFESIRYTAYDAQPTNSNVDWTICVGFNLKRRDAPEVFGSVLPGVSFNDVYAGTKSLSRSQCLTLFEKDLIETYIPRAKNVVGSQFCGLPLNVKIALVSAVYRGDLAYSHKTAGYMRDGNWCAVPVEYLNYDQYIRCHELGIPGVCTRMRWNADQFQTMC